jgi:hypothetical protein
MPRKAATQTTDDTTVFVDAGDPKSVITVFGEKVKIPVITVRRELELLYIIRDLAMVVIDSGVLNVGELMSGAAQADGGDRMEQLGKSANEIAGKFIKLFVDSAPERLVHATAAILGKEDEWVLDNLDSAAILNLVIPFLRNRRDKIAGVVQEYARAFQTMQGAQGATLQ